MTLLIALTGLLMATISVQAQESNASSRSEPGGVWRNDANYRQIEKAYQLLSDEDLPAAESAFSKLTERFSDDYERSEALLGLIQVHLSSEDFDAAITESERVLEINMLQNKRHFDLMFSLAQLYQIREDHDRTLFWIDRWLAESGEVRPEAHALKATVLASQENYSQALPSISQAIGMLDTPKKDWYQLKLFLHFELNQLQQSRVMLEQMIPLWSEDRQLWIQYSSLLILLKDDSTALAVTALAHRQGMLRTESELMQLVNLYGSQELPYWAGRVFEQGINDGVITATSKNLQQLGQIWSLAQERSKAVDSLIAAAELTIDGEIDAQVVYLMIDGEDWQRTITHARSALDKGGLDEREMGRMHEMIGISHIELGQNNLARAAFAQAMNSPDSVASSRQWLNLIADQEAKSATPDT